MNKQAVSAIFAWIFIMVVGGLIIGLFFTIANNQAQAGEDRLAQNALQQVNTILNTQASSFDTSTTVRIPARRIRLSCEAFNESGSVTLLSQLEIGGFSRITQEDLLVGRDIQSDRLILFSKEWRAPFRVGNILHVSSDEELLVVSGDEPSYTLPSSWEGVIPDVVNTENFTGSPIDASRYQNVRVVVFNETAFDPNTEFFDDILDPEGQQTHYMYVQYNNDVREAGNVTYWDNANEEAHGPYPYVGEGMLTGLLWQASPPEANCLQHKLAEDLKRQTTLQQARRQALQEHYGNTGNNACEGELTNIHLDNLYDVPGNPQTTNPLYAFEDFNEQVDNVRNQNERLLRGERCATIY